MWKDFLGLINRVLKLTDDVQTIKSGIKQLEKRDEDMNRIVNRLVHRVDNLEEKYKLEQEILLLKLENRILRELKGLPPAKPSDDFPNDPKN